MRYALLLLALFLTLPTPRAQTIYKSDPGVYVGLNHLSIDSYKTFSIDGGAGYRFANGFDLGGDVKFDLRWGRPTLGLGTRLGYTLSLAKRLGLRGDARAFIGLSDRSFRRDARAVPFGLDNYGVDATASLFRSVPLGNHVTLYPSAGVYLSSLRYAERKRADLAATAGNDYPTSYANGGLQLSLPVALKILSDKSLVFEPTFRYGGHGFHGDMKPDLGFGLKFNF